ncbi:MAG: hypothetical protein A3B68_06175 [Candidatus Melainabacteria bacterium RIFCSPHIGHO2_02_FULL_34_12]|nr:MAG: hypothetical protein A3B68_06175 [Candidatus Melainabacteria bacterium RIFCSPHIGHO2_02_FULL_34_12]
MANYIKRLSGESNNQISVFGNHLRPQELKSTSLPLNKDSECYKLNPHAFNFRQITDPRLRLLRAEKLHPRERASVQRGVLEEFLYKAELLHISA